MSTQDKTIVVSSEERMQIILALDDSTKMLAKYAESDDADGYWHTRLAQSIAALKKVEAA
jgi:hypothetical protein